MSAVPDAEVPVVGGREPCPCGSGKRYKACHGRRRRQDELALAARPFAGLGGECDWIALREIVPAAIAPVRMAAGHGGIDVTVVTVLPMAWPALRRADGAVFVGLQTPGTSGDPSRDIAHAMAAAAATEPGNPVTVGPPGPGPRLQDVLDPTVPFTVDVREGFDFWLEGAGELTADVRESLDRANDAAVPTRRLESVEAAYWCRIGERRHLRWVLPYEEDTLLDALCRLYAAGSLGLVEGGRYVGSFRAHGLLVPVWDLAAETEAEDLEEPVAAMARRIAEATAVTTPLTARERRAKAGVVSRQLTLR